MLKNSKNKGITLIALVITIIVLLILAGISISMLSGDNSILKKAGEARDLTEVSQEKENISLAYNSALIDKIQKKSNAITLDEFDKAIKSYDANAITSSEGSKIIVTFSNGHKYTLYKNGNIGEYEEPPLAKDTLTVTVNEDETIESLYYVNYPSAKGTIKCRVLYNDDIYGLQLISVNPVTKVVLGNNDENENVTGEMGSLERAQNSYNRAITTLNEKAEEYLETTDGSLLAIDARCIGSNPLNKNYPDNLTGDSRTAEMYTSTEEYFKKYTGKYFKEDENYKIDKNRMEKLGISNIVNKCWIASRRCYDVNMGSYKGKAFDIKYGIDSSFYIELWKVIDFRGRIWLCFRNYEI